jgi:ferric-dicitrate binding protein FerR (iron transport regulator)
MGEEEWEKFQTTHVLSPDKSGKLWHGIHKNTGFSGARYPFFRWMAVAASVLLIVGLSWYFIVQRQKTRPVEAASVVIAKNNTPEKMALRLNDGSAVELTPGSKLSYSGNANSLKTAVVLDGEASFDIAKNAGNPFSVYSHTVLITVLGTRFTVRSYEEDKATKVILHEGRVMVKVSDSSYYLDPGDIFVSSDSLSARVIHLQKDKDGCYVFENYPLDVVFDQLQLIYDTKITYNKAELGNRTFIGKIDKKDPLNHILQSIALLTKFGLHKEGDGFVISNHY